MNTVPPTTATVPPKTTFAVADARVAASNPTSNYGNDTKLRAKGGSSPQDSYMKFTVGDVTGPVSSAKLRLYVEEESVDGGSVRAVANTTWTETGITCSNAPALSGTALSSVGGVGMGQTIEFDLGSFVTGSGTYSLALTSAHASDPDSYSSRQGSNPPLLVVTTGSGPPAPVANFTAAPTTLVAGQSVAFTDTSTGSPTSWSWDFGNGQASTAQNPSHPYLSAGTFTVSLKATNSSGSDTETKAGLVTVSPVIVVVPVAADAWVGAANPTSNFGNKSGLKVQGGSSPTNAYLKFTVSGLSAPVSAAKLRVFVTEASASGGRAHVVADSSWTETAVTWASAPAISAGVLSSAGAVGNGQWVELDLGSSVTANGTYSFALTSTHATDPVTYASKQNATNQPELVLTLG